MLLLLLLLLLLFFWLACILMCAFRFVILFFCLFVFGKDAYCFHFFPFFFFFPRRKCSFHFNVGGFRGKSSAGRKITFLFWSFVELLSVGWKVWLESNNYLLFYVSNIFYEI